jgi:cobalt-zinc-cadmium efflux system outer membrane protein
MKRLQTVVAAGAAVFALSGCASTSPEKARAGLDGMIRERAGADLRSGEKNSDSAVKEATKSLLQEPLTADAAVQLALLNNPLLRGRLEEAGIAQAELVSAGLLENPKFHASLRFPSGGGAEQTGRELGIAENFLDVLSLPLRRKMANARFEQAKFRLSQEVLELAAEVKKTLFAYQAERQRLALRRASFETMAAAAKLFAGQRQAGNVSALDAAQEQIVLHDAEIELAREEAAEANARERLTLLMGVQGMAGWTAAAELPPPPPSDPDLKQLEEAALERRFDLAAARREPAVLAEALRASRMGSIGALSVGIDSEKDFDGKFGVGPSVEWSVPLFDRQQGASAKLRARGRQSELTIAALEGRIRYEVRVARTSLIAARQAARIYRETLLPLHERVLGESLKHYNYMLLGVYKLLQAKRDDFEARGAAVDALKVYWTAWAELELAVGGKMPPASSTGPEPRHGDMP